MGGSARGPGTCRACDRRRRRALLPSYRRRQCHPCPAESRRSRPQHVASGRHSRCRARPHSACGSSRHIRPPPPRPPWHASLRPPARAQPSSPPRPREHRRWPWPPRPRQPRVLLPPPPPRRRSPAPLPPPLPQQPSEPSPRPQSSPPRPPWPRRPFSPPRSFLTALTVRDGGDSRCAQCPR